MITKSFDFDGIFSPHADRLHKSLLNRNGSVLTKLSTRGLSPSKALSGIKHDMVVGFLLENWLDTPLELIDLDEGYRGNPSGAKNTGKVRTTETNFVD